LIKIYSKEGRVLIKESVRASLTVATERYYRDKGIWFDLAAFRKDFEIHSSLLEP
jgi:hypothetical protein